MNFFLDKRKTYLLALLWASVIFGISTIYYLTASSSVKVSSTIYYKTDPKTWKKSVAFVTTNVYDSQQVIQQQKKLKIPKQFDKCKNSDIDMIWCILKLDTKTNKIISSPTPSAITQRLDYINEFKNKLNKPQEKLIKQLANNISTQFILENPSVVFQNFDCKTDFCRKIITTAKKDILSRLYSRWVLKTSHCNRLSKNLKQLCLDLFK